MVQISFTFPVVVHDTSSFIEAKKAKTIANEATTAAAMANGTYPAVASNPHRIMPSNPIIMNTVRCSSLVSTTTTSTNSRTKHIPESEVSVESKV